MSASSKPSNPLEVEDQGKLRYTWFTGKIGNNIIQKNWEIIGLRIL
jgi:hypothetical protein